MVKIAKDGGIWAVQFVSNGLSLFKSASRATCREWAEFNNYPVSATGAAQARNATVGKQVWSARP